MKARNKIVTITIVRAFMNRDEKKFIRKSRILGLLFVWYYTLSNFVAMTLPITIGKFTVYSPKMGGTRGAGVTVEGWRVKDLS